MIIYESIMQLSFDLIIQTHDILLCVILRVFKNILAVI